MTLLESLKVAQDCCTGSYRGDTERTEAAAVLARLEEELPKLTAELESMASYLGDKWNFADENSEGDLVEVLPTEVTEVFPAKIRAILSRLDAAPKEGS